MHSFINALVSLFDTLLHAVVPAELGAPASAYANCKTLADVERVNQERDRRVAV